MQHTGDSRPGGAAGTDEPREIGGYFELERLVRHEYYPGLLRLNCARSALLYVLRARKLQKLYVPYYICGCIADMCRAQGIECALYRIGPDFLPAPLPQPKDGEALLLANVYGLLTDGQIDSVRAACGRMILDNTHAFFNAPEPGTDTFYSCRKFFGVPDGAYLSTDARLPDPLAPARSADRMEHLLGRAEHSATAYFSCFQKTDARLDDAPMLGMSGITQNLLGAIDYPRVIEKRRENYQVYDALLSAKNRLRFSMPNVPFVYPFYARNGGAIRKALAAQRIYVATYWPNVLALPKDTVEYDYAENILPLPLDQRYGPEDCERVIAALTALLP